MTLMDKMLNSRVENLADGPGETGVPAVVEAIRTRPIGRNKVEVVIDVAGMPKPFHVGETRINSTEKQEKDVKNWAQSVAEKLRRKGRSFSEHAEDSLQ